MSTDEVKDAYGAQARDITGMLGAEVSAADPDHAVIEPWADTVKGQILDVGSGTGRWAGHLAGLGQDIDGLEPVKQFVDFARTAHPAVSFWLGAIDDLAGSDVRWAGILAWYSLIHLGPDDLPNALAILRSVLEDDGTMLMSFFSGPRLEPFNHPVATAYRWPLPDMARALDAHGLIIGEINFETMRDLFRAPRPHPSPIGAVRFVPARPRPRHGTHGDDIRRVSDLPCKAFLDVVTQPGVVEELGSPRAACEEHSLPLRH